MHFQPSSDMEAVRREQEFFSHPKTPNETLLGQGDAENPVTLGELIDYVCSSGRSDVYEVCFLQAETLNGKARNTSPRHWSDAEYIEKSFPMNAGESYDLRVGKGYIAFGDFLIQDVPRDTPITVEAQGTDDQESDGNHAQQLDHDFGRGDDKRRPRGRERGSGAQDSDKYEYADSRRRGDKEGRPRRRRRKRRSDEQRRSSVERRECTFGDILAEVRERVDGDKRVTVRFDETIQIRSSLGLPNTFFKNRSYALHISDDYVSCDSYHYANIDLSHISSVMVTVH